MAKYSIVELAVSNGNLVGVDQLSNNQKRALELNNAIYIYRGTRSKKVYIGQTMHFIERHKQHYNGMEEKFSTADFNKVIVIFSVYFNRSAMDDVESQLITYFMADNSKKAGAVSSAYLRLKNLQLGYTLPKNWTRKICFEKVRFSISANNLFTLTSYPYVDPEGPSGGAYYPQLRSFTFGVELTIGKN